MPVTYEISSRQGALCSSTLTGDIKKKMNHIDSLSFYLKHRKAFHEVENTLLQPAI
jgi:hypothetical protein